MQEVGLPVEMTFWRKNFNTEFEFRYFVLAAAQFPRSWVAECAGEKTLEELQSGPEHGGF